jgi:hypothetical protein
MEETRLTTTTTVKDYLSYKSAQDHEKIADLIYSRFMERYIEPFENNLSKHGFAMMAVSCLMIEALFCFQKGRKKTSEKGGDVFEQFFSDSSNLNVFIGLGLDFYENVRCGILHQGETYAGWKIVRKGPLLDVRTRTINATKFISALKNDLRNYTDNLRCEPFQSEKWKCALRKLDNICNNCNYPAAEGRR